MSVALFSKAIKQKDIVVKRGALLQKLNAFLVEMGKLDAH
jgi:hypothetical protein